MFLPHVQLFEALVGRRHDARTLLWAECCLNGWLMIHSVTLFQQSRRLDGEDSPSLQRRPTRSDAAAQNSVFDSTFICCSIYMFYLHPRSIPLKTAPLPLTKSSQWHCGGRLRPSVSLWSWRTGRRTWRKGAGGRLIHQDKQEQWWNDEILNPNYSIALLLYSLLLLFPHGGLLGSDPKAHLGNWVWWSTNNYVDILKTMNSAFRSSFICHGTQQNVRARWRISLEPAFNGPGNWTHNLPAEKNSC